MALLLVLLVTSVGQSFTSVPMLFAQPRYYGEFSDSGALRAGDKVRIAGMDVGTVQDLTLATGHGVLRVYSWLPSVIYHLGFTHMTFQQWLFDGW